DVGSTAGCEVRADARALVDRLSSRDRLPDSLRLRDVAGAVEDCDHRRLLAVPEGMERALVRLVGRVAGDRELRQPALRHLPGGEPAEQREYDPGGDHDPPAAHDQVGEAFEHGRRIRDRIIRCQIVYDLTKWCTSRSG